MAERNGLLNRRTGYTVPWVRIPPSPHYHFSGRSVARLSRHIWDVEAASSNLAAPTKEDHLIKSNPLLVGAARFELATSTSQMWRDDRATLRPERFLYK